MTEDLALQRRHFGRLQDAIDRVEETSYCAKGHPGVAYTTADCPVCAVKRATGYSEKWCDACGTVTPHVGGMHVHASCVQCLSQLEVIRAYLRA
jgi:hypothetical protein